MATLTGHLVADTYKALLKLIDNDVLTASEKQISDGFGGGSSVFIDQNGFLRAAQYKVTGGTSSQFLKANGSLDSNTYLPTGTTTSAIGEGSNLYFTQARVLATTLGGFVAIAGTVTAADTVLTSIEKIWYNIINGGGGGGGGYVPYIGATQDLNLGTFGLIGDFVQFNTTNSAIPVGAGTMAWNNTDGTVNLKLKGGDVTLQIGQEQVTRVVNKTGDDLLEENYQAVYISGAQGQRLKVDLALAVTEGTSAGTLGLVTETILDNQEGFVTSSGLVNDIDTTGDLQTETWADGDILYLSPTVAGNITNVKPLAPDHTVIMGFVVYAHAIHGKIYVKVDNGYEIEELHDVQVITRTDEDILQWYEDDLVWRNINLLTAITNAGGISGLGDINYVPKFDTVNSITNSLIYDDGTDIGIATISPTFPADRSGLVVRANGVNSSEILLQSSINTDATIQGLAIANIFDEGGAIYQRANQHLRFGTNNLERMRLTEGGYLAIGLTAPSSIIHAKDSTAYGKIIIDNNGLTGGGSFSASQNGTETAIFGVSGSWATNTTSDAAVVATRANQGIKFYTNGSTTAKGGIDSVGDSFIGQLPAYYAGVTNFIVQGIAAGSLIGITHFDGTIKGIFSTLNSGVNIGSDTPHPVIFRADDIESARIASDGKWLFGTNVNDNVNIIQVNGSIIATSLKKSGGIATEFLKADGSVTSLTSSISGITYNNTTGDFSLTVGYVIPLSSSATNWDTAYNSRIASLTTTGSSGNATFIANVLNIPTITLSGIGGQPIATNLTSLSTLNYVSTSFVKMTGSGAFSLDTNTYYLLSNPNSFIPLTALSSTALGLTYTNTTGVFSLTAGYMIPTSVQAAQWNTAYTNTISSATGPLSITSNVISIALATASVSGYLSASDFNLFNGKESVLTFSSPLVRSTNTISINQASGSVNGYLSSTDWTTFNGKQATISLTTTATSGPATLVGSTLNVPNYSAGASAVRNVSTFTATSGQTTFTITGGYTVGLIDVFINGARLSTADYTATNSSTVVLGTGAVLNDIVDVVNYTATFTAGISGTGTANYITKWTGTSVVNNSIIYDNTSAIGIGTNAPRTSASGTNKTLDVKGGIYFGDSGVESCTINNDDSMIFNIDANNTSTSNFFRWATNTTLEAGGKELMRLSEAGFLGIGTTAADYAITISGATEATSGIRIKNTDGVTSNSRLIIEQANAQSMNMYSAGNGFTFNYTLTGGIQFYDGVANAARLSISGAGNLGFGVTPFTNTLSKGFDLIGGGGMFSIGSSFYIMSNAYYNTEWRYKATAGTNGIALNSDGSMTFSSAVSGTINTAIPFTTKMTITSAGHCYLGDGFGASNHRINRKVSQGGVVLVVSGYDSSANDTSIFYGSSGAGGNGAGTAMWLSRNDSTNRSINAGGTVNASGSDYAEYMTKSVNDVINKGDIVGIDINGKLTNIYLDAISFVVKSTDPSYVGGDVWGNDDAIGKKPIKNTDQTDEEFGIIMKIYETKLEEERNKVDRIAFSGQVPCNILGANVGDYIIPINKNGKIDGIAISNPTLEQYRISVGKVWKIMDDGRAWIAVKIG